MSQATGVCRPLLCITGLWPYLPDGRRRIINAMYFSIAIVFCGLTLPQLFAAPIDLLTILNAINVFTTTLINMMKYLTTIIRFSKFKQCLLTLESDWNKVNSELERNIMNRNAARGKFYGLICFSLEAFCVVGISLSSIFQFYFSSAPRKPDSCPFLYTIWTSYEVCTSSKYEILYFVHIMHCACCGLIDVSINCFIMCHVMHAIGQFEILNTQLEHMGKNREALGSAVMLHTKVLQFTDDLEASFNLLTLYHFTGSATILCSAAFSLLQHIQRQEVMGIWICISFFFVISFHLFLYCFVSEELFQKSLQVGDSIFNSSWYDECVARQKCLVLPMIRSSKPSRLTAGRFIDLSLENFLSVIKTTGAYMSVLRKMS